MLSGNFVNCYGIKKFDLKGIKFENSRNKAIIYAPNGIMKTSFANVFDDIANGNETKDRIFNNKSSYVVNYYANKYTHTQLNKNSNIFVVKSFSEQFDISQNTVSTLLADEKTRKEYERVLLQFKDEVNEFISNFSVLSGIRESKLEIFFADFFILTDKKDWIDIFEKIEELRSSRKSIDIFEDLKYEKIINDKTLKIMVDAEFTEILMEYVNRFNKLITNNELLNMKFNDYNAEELGKNLKKHNLFENNHKIVLNNGKEINNITEWEKVVALQLNNVYKDDMLGEKIKALKKKLEANEECRALKDIIMNKKGIIPYLSNIPSLKELLIVNYINSLDKSFSVYYAKLKEYSDTIKKLYETANGQSERWKKIVDDFNRRFRVPFSVRIINKANILLKDEAPNLVFDYTICKGMPEEETATFIKNDLVPSLSMGEKRAMYLLYILFDIQVINEKVTSGSGKTLIIVDDIADSFDYKNKYAIIEYLYDISKNSNIDLLILTHNFDFYRTVSSRLDIKNKYLVQKDITETLFIENFGYTKDYFANVIVDTIKNGKITNDDNKIKLVASIPFYRNICEYMQKEEQVQKLTCLLHIKENPIDTLTLTINDLWLNIRKASQFSDLEMKCDNNDEKYIEMLGKLASSICDKKESIFLENKILLSIAIRLTLEMFLKRILIENNEKLECSSDQTREWGNLAKKHLDDGKKNIIDEVNLITPENIHINSFMYEPIIDISDWKLKELYKEVKYLLESYSDSNIDEK